MLERDARVIAASSRSAKDWNAMTLPVPPAEFLSAAGSRRPSKSQPESFRQRTSSDRSGDVPAILQRVSFIPLLSAYRQRPRTSFRAVRPLGLGVLDPLRKWLILERSKPAKAAICVPDASSVSIRRFSLSLNTMSFLFSDDVVFLFQNSSCLRVHFSGNFSGALI